MADRDTFEQIQGRIEQATAAILRDYRNGRDIDNVNVFTQPDSEMIIELTTKLLTILFPGYHREKNYRSYNNDSRIALLIEDVTYNLQKQITIALAFRPDCENLDEAARSKMADELVVEFIQKIPAVRELVNTDLQAGFEGDPAAFNKEEIVLCYPGFLAITVNRLAHELFLLKIPLIPRMMTEYAHSRTGIDIHPGATIGKYFFMDHGTGIVVGETSVIGEHVKVYQGVTIGALSTRGGQRLKGSKRHPTIEDEVTIYAGASILGGETVIGKGSVIGSNVFITSSVAPGTRMSVKTQELIIHNGDESFPAAGEEPWYYII